MGSEGLTPEDAAQYVGMTLGEFLSVYRNSDWRIGQIWYNHLNREDRMTLNGTIWDPFYSDDWSKVLVALEFLLERR